MKYLPNDALVYSDDGGVSEQWNGVVMVCRTFKNSLSSQNQKSYKVEDRLTTLEYQTTENHCA